MTCNKGTLRHSLGILGWAITFALVAFWSGVVGSWVADRNVPIKFQSLTPLSNEVLAGDYIKMQYRFVRHDHCSMRVARLIVDGDNVRHVLEDTTSHSRGPIGYDTFVAVLKVPDTVSPGLARYLPTIYYECNPIHRFWPVVFHVPEMYFTVLAR